MTIQLQNLMRGHVSGEGQWNVTAEHLPVWVHLVFLVVTSTPWSSAQLDLRVNNSSVGPPRWAPHWEVQDLARRQFFCWPCWDFSNVVSSVAHLAADHNFPVGFYFQHDAVSGPTDSTGKGRGAAHYGNVCGDQSSKIIRCYITECHILWGTEAHPAGINWAHFVRWKKW